MKLQRASLGGLAVGVLATAICWPVEAQNSAAARSAPDQPLLIVVMDPLCDKLACDCVQGYAQRKYEALAKYLLAKTGYHSKLVFGESIAVALEGTDRRPDFVIGKYSVARHGAAKLNMPLTPIAQLTGKDGSVLQSGLIVVRANDPAAVVEDLASYHVIFGPEDCDEKNAAAKELLESAGVTVPETIETAGACSDAARKLLEFPESTRAAAVISSYAQPLLEGCGTIKKGDLRIVGETKPLHFVTAFVHDEVPSQVRGAVLKALLATGDDSDMLAALETGRGFVPFQESVEDKATSLRQTPAAAQAGDSAKKN